MDGMKFSLAGLDYAIIVIYLLITFVIGFVAERFASKGADAFFLGGNKLPWWALGASGMASNVDISGTAVAVALIYAMGVKGFFIEIRGGIVLVMAVLLAYMGKWNRRSAVMTRAEWMIFRFGNGTGGKLARLASALTEILFAIWVTAYFTIGLQLFIAPLHPFGPEFDFTIASLIVISVGLYSMVGGFAGVVWTDVFQGGLILFGVIYITSLVVFGDPLPATFFISAPSTEGYSTVTTSFTEWTQLWPRAAENFPGTYASNNFLQWTIGILLFRTLIDGMSGSGGYMIQRFLAAKNEREAGLVSLFWTVLLMFRWPMVAAIAILGIQLGIKEGAPIQNPEQVLPIVLERMLPVGMKGLMIAAFLAAFMSTLSSALNSCAAYWSRDIFMGFIWKDKEDTKMELLQGRLATAFFVVAGLAMSTQFSRIDAFWGWLTTALVGGLAVPLFLRWYWWRLNGEGFAIGTIAGNVVALVFLGLSIAGIDNLGGLDIKDDLNKFLIIAGFAFVGCVVGAYATAPTRREVLENFYRATRPFGFWSGATDSIPATEQKELQKEHTMEIISMCLALPWQLCLFLFPMMLVLRVWNSALVLGIVLAVLSVGLYFTWYRRLSTELTTPKPKLVE
jgi:SSS family solute:Na+ symporter